ncbi:MAG: amino acid adenylation domain-containing protein, partial [Acidobacteriota bacterium]
MKTLSTRLASLSPKQRALLERRLKERGVTASDLPIPPRVEPRSTFPLTFAQERLWFLFRMDPADPAYNLATGDRLCGVLDVSALLRAFDEIVRRHESLRTRFPDVDGKPIQLVGSRMGLEIPHLDLGRLGENHRHAETRRLSREQNQRPFDLARGPLLRCTLFRLAADDHVLAFTMHHIISDGVSIDVLLREVSALYHAFSRRRPSPLAKLPIQYGDFAVWQWQQLTVEQLDEQLAYWRERLADLPPVLELPADRPRPAVGSFRGGSVAVALPRPLTSVLRALARRQGATLFVTLLAAFKLLLGRITGQQDLAVGIPVSGRDRLETEGLIGFFINTLVLRSDHSDNPGWLELLARVHRLVLDAHDHQDLPFARLVEELRPPRSLSYTPIFQVMFTLLPAQTQPQRTGDSPGLSLAPYGSELGAATHDLSLSLEDAGAEIRGQLSYNTDLFDHTTVARIAGHLQVLLRAVTDESATGRLSDLPMLSPPEQQVLLREWNAPASVSPTGTLLEMFAAQVDRTPDAVAVACGPLRLTYQELDHRANRLAHALRGRGVAPEVVVGVLLERSPELVIAVLAVLEAGGAYLPLDPAQPAERLAFMIDDARVPILLTEPPLSQELRLESSPAVIGLDGTGSLAAGSEEIPSLPPLRGNPALVPLRGNPALVPLRGNPALVPLRGNLAGGAEGENLAYLIYTSGSTGRPKGTELRHAGLLNLITWHQEIYRVAPGDRATLVASPGFDASVWEIWPNLTAGATLHIPAPATVASPPDLLAWLAAEGITLSFLPTPLAEALLAEPLPPRLSLRALLTGGDKLHHSPKRALPFDLVNHYGPTESTVVTSWTPVAPGVRSPPIGRPLTHTRVYLLTAGLQPVPLRVPGELHVGGLSLARGYRRHAALTAERFIPDPLSDTAGERLYKTGDRVRYQADGQLEFLGRLDRQVKVRGFRIELGEIEAVLNAQPAIREAAVLHREIRGVGAKALVAYVVAQARSPGQAAGLRELLGDKLPTFMVPSVFVFMEALPLLPNGKLDRRALPQPDRPESAAYLAPSGETERTIAAIWQELLRIERVGTH